MRTVTVNVQIQMDINSKGSKVDQVIGILEAINEVLQSSNLSDYQPQIFTNAIDKSDIV